MASCEKCWKDAHSMELANPEKTRGEYYIQLLEERYNQPCNAEEQAGENSSYCNRCERWTVHQHTRKCVICEKD